MFLFLVAIGVVGYFIYQDRLDSTGAGARLSVEDVYGQYQDQSKSPDAAARTTTTHQAPTFNAPPVYITTGILRARPGRPRVAPLEIRTPYNADFLVKLINVADYSEELAMYIEGGQPFTTDVPLGTYEIRYCAGTTWYGEQHRFGPDTACSKAEKQFSFYQQGNYVSGYTIELILQVGGNLRTMRIDPSEF